VVVQDGFFDIYVDDLLQIVRHHRTYADGCFGLHARGVVQFRELTAYHWVDKESRSNDWRVRCRPRHLFP